MSIRSRLVASVFAALLVVATPARAEENLPRRGTIGVGVQPGPQGRLVVSQLRPGGPAERAGLRLGDELVSIDGTELPGGAGSPQKFADAVRVLKGGHAAAFKIIRAGTEETLTITLDPLPTEVVPGSTVEYSSVAVPAGYRLRTILTTPEGEAAEGNAGPKRPAFLWVQGIYCASVDRPAALDAVDTKIVHAMAKAGFVTMRIDKPGLGDSQGPPCGDINFETELEGYKAALEQLRTRPGVDPERIYIFGHSMGGVMAPYLIAEKPVRGVIVYGTLARTWFEYQFENARRQMTLRGATPGQINEALKAEAVSSSMILVEKKSLGDVWAAHPELKVEDPMLEPERIASRHVSFYHQLQDLNIAQAWSDAAAKPDAPHVLAIHGEYDWVTTLQDHEMIAKLAGKGKGESLSLPATDHGFTTHNSLDESLDAMGQGTWNAQLPVEVLAWIDRVEGKAKEEASAAPESPTIAKAGGGVSAQAVTKDEPAPASGPLPEWRKLTTERYPGKQDDVFFINERTGWYVNGAGKIFKSTDGGETWVQKIHKPGTYFRCIAFVDEKVGFAGNIGPGYFPNVTDATPLYATKDGGETWDAVTTIEGDPVVGLCALEVLREKFVNAGNLDERVRIVGVGRVGGPAAMIYSDDLGKTWKQRSLGDGAMAFDVHFFDRQHGIVASASDADVSVANAVILATSDGGETWTRVYQSSRPFEITWKVSFPTREVGYVTIQSYNPDPAVKERFVAKTTDGGKTWSEIPLSDNPAVRQFGVAFIDAQRGWIGAMPHGFATVDGGATWTKANFGNAVNKIRLVPKAGGGVAGFAIGVDVSRVDVE